MSGKPVLVLLHGWGTNAQLWAGVVSELSAGFEIHTPELPGHGSSQLSAGTLEEVALSLAAQVERPAYWLGWSLGAQLALQIALQVPGQIRALLLVSATPAFRQADDWQAAMPQDEFDRFYEDFRKDAGRTLKRFMALQTRGDAHAQSVLRQLRMTLDKKDQRHPESIAWGLDLLRSTDLRAQLSGIGQPVHLIHGVNDQLIPVDAGRYIAEATGADITLWEETGHAPFLSRPAPFIDWVQQSIA